jgi:hypothetical protein
VVEAESLIGADGLLLERKSVSNRSWSLERVALWLEQTVYVKSKQSMSNAENLWVERTPCGSNRQSVIVAYTL